MSTRANAIDLSGSDDETQKKRKPEVTEEKDKKSLRREKAKDRCFGCNKYRILNNDWQCRLCVIKKALTSQEERQDAEFDYDSAEDTCSLLGLRGSDQDTDSDSD
jgi:hypothetical protein